MSGDCLFCSIVAGDISATVVLDRERVFAFRDIAPAAPTHVLVVPKEHIPGFGSLSAEHAGLLAELVDAANEVARLEGVVDSGFRIVSNVGSDAGQTVFHLHLHVLGGRNLGAVAS